ncbi:fibronectin type III-like domain-contianing protein [Streptomyces sp. NPDC059153]|uniref:fibronectin type III-like domain-contianing protein n=1 Tax=unclassified Streptomyces TaxID=2593676 RepID=UPI0036A5A572
MAAGRSQPPPSRRQRAWSSLGAGSSPTVPPTRRIRHSHGPPGEYAEVDIDLPERVFQTWDEATGPWTTVPGRHRIHASRSETDDALTEEVGIAG